MKKIILSLFLFVALFSSSTFALTYTAVNGSISFLPFSGAIIDYQPVNSISISHYTYHNYYPNLGGESKLFACIGQNCSPYIGIASNLMPNVTDLFYNFTDFDAYRNDLVVDVIVEFFSGFSNWEYIVPSSDYDGCNSSVCWLDSSKTRLLFDDITGVSYNIRFDGSKYSFPFGNRDLKYLGLVKLQDMDGIFVNNIFITGSQIPVLGGDSTTPTIPIFSWSGSTVTGSLASMINDLENTYGINSGYCTSGDWSSIVNSSQQLFTRSERSTAIYNYCGYLRAVGSGQTSLIVGFGDQTETITQTGALITINQAITDQRGIDSSRCTSGVWSGIVSSPTQLYVRSRQASEVRKYCQNNQAILSGSTDLEINFNSYPYGKFFTCSHWLVTTGFITINLSNTIPKIGLFNTKGSFIDFDIAKPVRCMYSSYLYGSNQSKFTFDSMPWTGQLFFKSSPYYQSNNETNKSFLIWFLNLALSFPAFLLAIKRMR